MSEKKYNLRIIPEVVDDIELAKQWYNGKRSGLGDKLVNEVESAIRTIQNNPLQFQKKYKDLRQARTSRFPYLISYLIDKLEIIILSVLHGSRNPKEFIKRLK